MTEPKVGMKFGTYKSKNVELSKKYSHSVNMQQSGKSGLVTVINFKNKNGNNIAHSTSVDDGKNLKIELATEQLLYRGDGKSYDSGYTPYSRIYGTNTYAIDLNGNGIVDKNEIFRNKK